jgi:opacity protein-like surface antigen
MSSCLDQDNFTRQLEVKMKTWIPAAIILSTVFYAFPAASQGSPGSDSGLYINAHVLGSNPTVKDDPTQAEYEFEYGYGGTGAIGYALAFPDYSADLRFELEASYRMYELSSIDDPSTTICGAPDTFCLATGNYNVAAAMVNFYIDFHTQSRFVPSIGFGYGRARMYFDDWVVNGVPWANGHVDADIYQFIGGIGYKLSPGLILDAEYRYVQPNDDNWDGYLSNELLIGFRMIL